MSQDSDPPSKHLSYLVSGLLLTSWLKEPVSNNTDTELEPTLFKEDRAGASNIGTDPSRRYTTAPVA